MSNSIKIKNYKVLKSLLQVPYHSLLIELNVWCTIRYSKWTYTGGYRSKKIHPKDSGIHMTIPCRATDVRSSDFEDPEKVRDDINKHWLYDPKRLYLKCAIYHNSGQGWHFHLQVHPNTKYLGG